MPIRRLSTDPDLPSSQGLPTILIAPLNSKAQHITEVGRRARKVVNGVISASLIKKCYHAFVVLRPTLKSDLGRLLPEWCRQQRDPELTATKRTPPTVKKGGNRTAMGAS